MSETFGEVVILLVLLVVLLVIGLFVIVSKEI